MSANAFGRLFNFLIRAIRVIRGLKLFLTADYADDTDKEIPSKGAEAASPWTEANTALRKKPTGIPTKSVFHEMTQKLIALTFLALAAVLFVGCASTTETTTTTRTREQSSMYAR